MRKVLAFAVALLAAMPAASLLNNTVPVVAASGPTPHVAIVRDAWGVPHIYADDAYSLFYGNGYAQAQDRLAQMEILRHVGRGELAKLIGPSGLVLDLVTRRELYTHQERVEALAALSPEWQLAFGGYADGVNAWIEEAKADPAKLPVEYPALGILPEPWVETDTIAIAQYLLDVFGRGSGGQEVENAQLFDQLRTTLGSEQAAADALTDLIWVRAGENRTYTTIKWNDGATFTPLPAEEPLALSAWSAEQRAVIEAAVDAEPVDDAAATPGDALAALGWPFQFGSNAQLIAGRHTASGQPILYGGPQMGYFTPMIPYELGLHGGDCAGSAPACFDAVGMGVAGAPGVIIGRNAAISWTVTSGASDQVDTVAETLVGPRQYVVDGETLDMDCRTETHLVRPGPADFAPKSEVTWRPPLFDVIEQEVCRTIHGPVLYRTPDGAYAFASQRSYRGDELRSGAIWLQIGTIRSIEDFTDLFADFQFTFNFNLAEAGTAAHPAGRIAYFHVGAQPQRSEALDPRLPRPGAFSWLDWKDRPTGGPVELLHLTGLPHVIDPATGYTVNWNNNPAPGWASGDARELWGSIHRAELMHELLQPLILRGGITLDDVRAVNVEASTRAPYADDLFPLLRGAVVDSGDGAALLAADGWAASGFSMRDANGDGKHDHAGFRLYELWRDALQAAIFADELGARVRAMNFVPGTNGADPHAADHGDHNNKENVIVDAVAGRTTHAWCDDVTTPSEETCADASMAALLAALTATTNRHCGGGDCSGPDWSTPFPMRKSRFSALGAGPAYQIDISNRPSFQHFYDWGLPEGDARSRNVLPPGAAGHMNGPDYALLTFHRNGCGPCPVPAHLQDQLALYENYGDKPLLHDCGRVLAHEESRIIRGSGAVPCEAP